MSGVGQGASVRVFISYSSHDADLVQRLKDGLARAGVDVWLDHEQLTPDTPDWREAIWKGIDQTTHLICCASETAAKSQYVDHELARAHGKHKTVFLFWIRGSEWYDCAPMGHYRAQYIDGRGDSLDIGLTKILTTLGVSRMAPSRPAPVQPAPDTETERLRRTQTGLDQQDTETLSREQLAAQIETEILKRNQPPVAQPSPHHLLPIVSPRLLAAGKTDVGLQHEQNEDAFHVQVIGDSGFSGIFIVSDGMGGYDAGEIASQIAVETIRDKLLPLFDPSISVPTVKVPNKDAMRGPHLLFGSLGVEHYAVRLNEAVKRANGAIVEYGDSHKEAKGLGATVTAAFIVDGQAFIANVGNSRTYLVRDGKIERVTRDHSLVDRLVEAGQITPDEVYDHPSRNLIYRSLGAGHSDVDVDIFHEKLKAGDTLLLCCDGLWGKIRDPQLLKIISETEDVDKASDLLISTANENGGEDNITAVLVRCVEA